MIYNKINFNERFWDGKPVNEFINHESHHGLTEKQLKEAHALMQTKAAEKRDVKKDS
jgi:hypothetical protein